MCFRIVTMTSVGLKIQYHVIYLQIPPSLMAQMVKNLPVMQETWVQFLGRKDPLEKEMVMHSSILAGKIPWTEKPGKLQSMGSQRVRHDLVTKQQQ